MAADPASQLETWQERFEEPGRARRTWGFIRRWPVFPVVVLTMVVVSGLFAHWVAPKDPYESDLYARLTPPAWQAEGSFDHILGVDHQGRDVLSRVIHGARVSLVIAFFVIGLGGTLGTILGIVSGYYGGWVDDVIQRMVEILIAVPFLLVALIVVVVFGASLPLLIGVLAVFGWTGFARQTRTVVLQLRTTEYVLAARISGASPFRMIAKHLFPGVLNLVVVLATLSVGGVILTESILSFLGAGVAEPTPTWGNMVAGGRDYLANAWWIAFFPGMAIFLTVLSFNFLGDWLRDYLDPRLRQAR